MALDKLLANGQNTLSRTPEIFVNGTGKGVLITAVTVSNSGNASRSYQAYIVDAGGSPTSPIIPSVTIDMGDYHTPDGLIGQVIPPGGTLQFESSFANSLLFTVTGREQR